MGGMAVTAFRILSNNTLRPAFPWPSRRPVEVITLGDVALVAGKPEINACTERQLQERSKYPHTLYLSMVGGGMKYMPDQASYERLSWEALTSMLMPGAAEKFVDTAIQLLEEK